jgi:thiamine-phosphate pyrophosphorylase
MPTDRGSLAGVYLVTPDAVGSAFDRVLAIVAHALDAGVRVVQYRNKVTSTTERSDQAGAITQLVAAAGGLAIINDDVDLAAQVGSHGVHLGRNDGDVAAARRRFPDGLLGVSCYDDLARAAAAVAAGADAIAFGSVYPSVTKPTAVHAPLALLGSARARWPAQRVIAIGGIGHGTIAEVAESGAHAAAVISAVFEADEPARAARELVRRFTEGKQRYESQRAAV